MGVDQTWQQHASAGVDDASGVHLNGFMADASDAVTIDHHGGMGAQRARGTVKQAGVDDGLAALCCRCHGHFAGMDAAGSLGLGS